MQRPRKKMVQWTVAEYSGEEGDPLQKEFHSTIFSSAHLALTKSQVTGHSDYKKLLQIP